MFQLDLLRVLTDFKIETEEQFYKLPPGQRTYFVRRLYQAFVLNEEDALRDLSTAGGVKFHFMSSGDLSVASTNIPSTAFLKKLCFYSNRTLITFPFKELRGAALSRAMKGLPAKEWRQSVKRQNDPLIFGKIHSVRDALGGHISIVGGKGYSLDPAAFRDFLATIGQLKPAIAAGLTYLLPAFPEKKREFRRIGKHLTSANFSLPELKRQFNESELIESVSYRFEGDLLNLYLPYFTSIPLERILEIRDKQSDMYNDFQRYLQNLLEGLSVEETEQKLLTTLREIDSGIRELDKKFRSIKADYGRKDVYMGLGVLCTGLALFAGIEWSKEIAQLIASATGTATGMQFLSNLGEKKKATGALADDRFFLPWLIHRETPRGITISGATS